MMLIFTKILFCDCGYCFIQWCPRRFQALSVGEIFGKRHIFLCGETQEYTEEQCLVA